MDGHHWDVRHPQCRHSLCAHCVIKNSDAQSQRSESCSYADFNATHRLDNTQSRKLMNERCTSGMLEVYCVGDLSVHAVRVKNRGGERQEHSFSFNLSSIL